MTIFYAPDILQTLTLPEEESVHCARVLRLAEGAEVLVADGRGAFYHAKIVASHPKRTIVEILNTSRQSKPWNFNLHIAIAPTKNMDRIEWFVEKAVEIGIDEITFLRCRYSERKDLKTERIQKIMVSAMKQSQKAFATQIHPLTDFRTFIESENSGVRTIAHCYDEIEKIDLKKLCTSAHESYTILIGPEGDFSEEEVNKAISAGYQSVSLGESRLRTETAALVACMTPHLLL